MLTILLNQYGPVAVTPPTPTVEKTDTDTDSYWYFDEQRKKMKVAENARQFQKDEQEVVEIVSVLTKWLDRRH